MFTATDDTDTLPSVEEDEDYAATAERLGTVREELREARDHRNALADTWRERYGGPGEVNTETRETTLEEEVERILSGDEPDPSPRAKLASELAEAEDRVNRLQEARDLLARAERKERKAVARRMVVGEVEDQYKAHLREAVEAAEALREALDALREFEGTLEDRGIASSYLNPVTLPVAEVDGFVDRAESRLAEEVPPPSENGTGG